MGCDVLYFVYNYRPRPVVMRLMFYILYIIKDLSCYIVYFSNKTVAGSHRKFLFCLIKLPCMYSTACDTSIEY